MNLHTLPTAAALDPHIHVKPFRQKVLTDISLLAEREISGKISEL